MPELLCPWEPSTYLFFSSNVPALIHYSHAVAILSALGIGIFVFASNPKNPVTRLLLLFVLIFSIWAGLDVILWATNRPDVVMLSWSLQVLAEPLMYTLAFYLFFLFLYKRLPGLFTSLAVFCLLLPLFVLLPTTLNLEALSLSTCEAIEGPLAKYYTYFVHSILMLAIIVVGALKIPKLPTSRERLIAICFGLSLVTFLLSFTSGNIMSSFTDDWTISQYGLFGMPIFAGLIAYSVVQFKAFNAKVITSQMLVVVLALAVISLATLQEIQNVRIIAVATFVLVCILGYILVRSVQREIKQRERLEALTKQLEVANERLKELDQMKSEFLSIASHQLRAPITAVRGYAANLIEGEYGAIPEYLKEPLLTMQESSRLMVQSIEDYLNISRIEQNRMKYEKSDFDVADLAKKVVKELTPVAEKRKLTLSINAPENLMINADVGKVKQIFTNLIDNSIKYTEQGSVTVTVEAAAKVARITIADTGIGISADEIGGLFEKFKRARGANKVNTTGTGLGLYVAKQLAEGNGGSIKVESDGVGKGSRFIVELPAKQ